MSKREKKRHFTKSERKLLVVEVEFDQTLLFSLFSRGKSFTYLVNDDAHFTHKATPCVLHLDHTRESENAEDK